MEVCATGAIGFKSILFVCLNVNVLLTPTLTSCERRIVCFIITKHIACRE